MTRMQIEYVKNQIKSSLSIVDIAEKYGFSLKKKGDEFWCCCPFHKEKTPSFSVNPKKNSFCCLGCHESGDEIDFVMKLFKCSFKDAIERLANDFGIITNQSFSSEQIKRFKEQSEERERKKKEKIAFDNYVKDITDKVCNRNYMLYDIIQKHQPYNSQKLNNYIYTNHPEIVVKAQKQYNRNEMFLDAFSISNDLSDRECFIYGYENGEERLAKIVDMIKSGVIRINKKGDVLYG